jgi:trigger factor
MATITRENIGLLNDKITVKVEKGDYYPSFEKALKNYSKQANIPGFRKGMVPTGLVKKMYGTSVFTDEVLRTVEKELNNYMSTEKLEIFAQPLPLPENDARSLDMNSPSDYTFGFEVGLKPEFTLPDLGSANLKKYQIDVTDAMIDEQVAAFQHRNGTMTEPGPVSDDENVLNVTFIETDGAGNEVEGGIRKDDSVLVKYFTPAVRATLMGKQKDDVVAIQPSQAFDGKEREAILADLGLDKNDTAAADKHFNMLITKVGLIEKPAMDEAFFEAVFPGKEIKTEEAFRAEIKEQITTQWARQVHAQMQDQVYHYLLDNTTITFPDSFLKKWMQTNGEQAKTPEEVEKEYPTFTNQLKWTLIIDQLVKESGAEVMPDDIRNFAKQQLFGYMGMLQNDEDQPWLNDYIDRMMKDKKFVEDSYHRIQTEKVFDWAVAKASSTDVPISADDFQKMVSEHHHH